MGGSNNLKEKGVIRGEIGCDLFKKGTLGESELKGGVNVANHSRHQIFVRGAAKKAIRPASITLYH